MGQVLHGCATTTETVRRAIQNSQESLRALAKRYGINQKTVAKWKERETVADLPTGPREAKSTVLSIEEEAIIVAFRRHTLLPLDDCLYALLPNRDRSPIRSLARCTAALEPQRDAPIDAVETRSCIGKTSDSIASVGLASPLAG
jgi:transposase-like protein